MSISQIKKDGGSDSAVSSGSSYNSNGTSVTDTYGTLAIGADGSYYVADQSAADDLDLNDSVTDVFVLPCQMEQLQQQQILQLRF